MPLFPGRAVPVVTFVKEKQHVSWLIEGLLPDTGWTLFVGKPGIGKSTFAAQFCNAMAKGVPFLERKTIKTEVLFLQADSPTDEWREMLKRIAPTGIWYTMVDVPNKCLGNPEYVTAIKGLIERVNPGYVVFDSLYSLTAWPINTEAVLMPVGICKQLCGNIPWMLIHHPPQNESRAAGHHSLAANCSSEWVLLKNKLKIEKGRLVKDKEVLLSRDEDGLWVAREEDEAVQSAYTGLSGIPIL